MAARKRSSSKTRSKAGSSGRVVRDPSAGNSDDAQGAGPAAATHANRAASESGRTDSGAPAAGGEAGSHDSQQPAPADIQLSDSQRTYVSIWLWIHLICVGVALSATFARSPLQERFLRVVGGYVQLLHLDPGSSALKPAYHYTHGGKGDVYHRWEIVSVAEASQDSPQWVVIPDPATWSPTARRRFHRLGMCLAEQVEIEEFPASLALQAGLYARSRFGVDPDRLRVRRHLLQSPDDITGNPSRRDPDHETFFETVYEVRYLPDGRGGLEVVKLSPAGESAGPARE